MCKDTMILIIESLQNLAYSSYFMEMKFLIYSFKNIFVFYYNSESINIFFAKLFFVFCILIEQLGEVFEFNRRYHIVKKKKVHHITSDITEKCL